METPTTNDRTRSRLSSSHKKNRNSLDNSASKLMKTHIQREKIRKLNHYKSVKTKRAEILVKNRHIDNSENVDLEEKIEIDFSECENPCQIFQIKNGQSANNEIGKQKSQPLQEIKQPEAYNTSGISSKLSSNIIKRINSFKNSIKNIVNSNETKPPRQANATIKQQSMDNCQAVNKSNKFRRSISIGGFPSTNLVNKPSQSIRLLKKQESTGSVHFTHPKTSSSLANSKASSFSSSSSSLALRSHHNSSSSLSGKPVFKVSTKIHYNDSHLYRNDIPVDPNKNQKLINSRKISKTSTGSLVSNK